MPRTNVINRPAVIPFNARTGSYPKTITVKRKPTTTPIKVINKMDFIFWDFIDTGVNLKY